MASEKSLMHFLSKLGLRDSLQDANASSDAKEAAANELTKDLPWRADATEKSDLLLEIIANFESDGGTLSDEIKSRWNDSSKATGVKSLVMKTAAGQFSLPKNPLGIQKVLTGVYRAANYRRHAQDFFFPMDLSVSIDWSKPNPDGKRHRLINRDYPDRRQPSSSERTSGDNQKAFILARDVAMKNPLSLAFLHGGYLPGQGHMYAREQRWTLLSALNISLFDSDAPIQCGLCNTRMNGAEFIRHCDTGCCKGEGKGLASVRHTQIQNAFTRSVYNVNRNVKINDRTPAANLMFEADPNNIINSRRRSSSSSSSSTKLADRLLTIYNSKGMAPTGEIAIDFNCSNVTGKGREFSKAGDAASLGFENKMREYAHLDYTPSTDAALGNLIGVCFDSCGGWDSHARRLLNTIFHRDLGWSSENSRLWLKRRLVRRVSSVIWHHNGKMLEKALSGKLSRKSKGNNSDSSA